MKNTLEQLSQIQKVDAPPFLWTRIQQRIQNKKENNFSPTFTWVLSVSLTILIITNTVVFVDSFIESKKEKNLLQSMNLLPHNSLYK